MYLHSYQPKIYSEVLLWSFATSDDPNHLYPISWKASEHRTGKTDSDSARKLAALPYCSRHKTVADAYHLISSHPALPNPLNGIQQCKVKKLWR
jgi:hypothetical protein